MTTTTSNDSHPDVGRDAPGAPPVLGNDPHPDTRRDTAGNDSDPDTGHNPADNDSHPDVGRDAPGAPPAGNDSQSSGALPAAIRTDFDDGTRLDITIAGQSYPVFLIDKPAEILAEYLAAQRGDKPLGNVALICDENTADLFGLRTEADFIKAGFTVVALTVAAGESSKSWEVAGQLVSVLSNSNIERGDCIVALGGGMVSDLSGFVATVYERGLDLYLLPTTLLALVDAAIGGKVAVNRDEAKNLAGAFKQPKAIAADLGALAHLSDLEYHSGLAELVKTAILSGDEFLSYLEAHTAELLARDVAVLREAVVRAMCFKVQIAADDPYDRGLRMCLNYGHTIGHAIEQVSGYEVAHGLAVAEGMRFAARMAVQTYDASLDFVRRQDALLDALGLVPLDVKDYSMAELAEAMRRDKKNGAGEIRFVLVREPGVVGTAPVDLEMLYSHMRPWLGIKPYEPPKGPEPEPEPAAESEPEPAPEPEEDLKQEQNPEAKLEAESSPNIKPEVEPELEAKPQSATTTNVEDPS